MISAPPFKTFGKGPYSTSIYDELVVDNLIGLVKGGFGHVLTESPALFSLEGIE